MSWVRELMSTSAMQMTGITNATVAFRLPMTVELREKTRVGKAMK
jgi:hypothetical protein